jgi:hypothetical protein
MPSGSQLESRIAVTGMPSLLGFGDGDGFLVGVDHEQHVGQAAHFLDAAQRAFQLVLFAQQAQQFLLGQARLPAVVSVSSMVRRRGSNG